MHYKAVIFDLDGTLLDTLADLADSMNAFLEQNNYPIHEVDNYRTYVGNGIRKLAIRVLPEAHCQEWVIDQCVEGMKKEYNNRWDNKTIPYDGIPELLNYLIDGNLNIGVLTNKPHDLAVLMVNKLLPQWSFAELEGAKQDRPLKPDPGEALAIAKRIGVKPEDCIFVGDTNVDMMTAKAAGMFAIGVLWGFRDEQELVESGADLIINHPTELIQYLEKNN